MRANRLSIIAKVLSLVFLLFWNASAYAQTIDSCPIPACPTYTGVVTKCRCGDSLFRTDQQASAQYCCGSPPHSLQDQPCDESVQQQQDLERTFCSVAALAAKTGSHGFLHPNFFPSRIGSRISAHGFLHPSHGFLTDFSTPTFFKNTSSLTDFSTPTFFKNTSKIP